MTRKQRKEREVKWADLLRTVLTEPGRISEAYRHFHNYSAGNQALAFEECILRGLKPGPINTFNGWQKLGRHVLKGEKAIWLCMPVQKRRVEEKVNEETGEVEKVVRTWTAFVLRPNWFLLCQTDGDDYTPPALPEWDATRALAGLDITLEDFAMMNGNVLGYAHGHAVAVSPLGDHQTNTLVHEIAHVILGHTDEKMVDGKRLGRDLKEMEAECVALLVCDALGIGDPDLSRGYVQNWYTGDEVPEKNARRIMTAASKIMEAGRAAKAAKAQAQEAA